jgi:hypothetical protein
MPDESNDSATLDTWAIVEVMGHRKYAGRVTEQQIAGAGLVRVDVPEVTVTKYGGRETSTVPAFSKLIGPASIYCITPVSEELARKAATRIAYEGGDPIPVYIPPDRQLPAAVGAPTDCGVDVDWDPIDDNDDNDDGRPF